MMTLPLAVSQGSVETGKLVAPHVLLERQLYIDQALEVGFYPWRQEDCERLVLIADRSSHCVQSAFEESMYERGKRQ